MQHLFIQMKWSKKAKEDRAKFKISLKDALEAEKSRVRKKVTEPYETFRSEADDQRRYKRLSITLMMGIERLWRTPAWGADHKVREFYEDNIRDIGKHLPLERVMQAICMASTTMKSIKGRSWLWSRRWMRPGCLKWSGQSLYAGDMKKVLLELMISVPHGKRNQLRQRNRTSIFTRKKWQREQGEQEAQRKVAPESVMAAGRQGKRTGSPIRDRLRQNKLQNDRRKALVNDRSRLCHQEQLMKLKTILKRERHPVWTGTETVRGGCRNGSSK